MRIAIDVSPLESGHKVRGVGFYLAYLKKSLLENFPEHEYIFFTQKEKLQQGIDVIHYPYFDPFFLTLPFINKYKTVVTVHDLTPLVFPGHFPAGLKGSLRWQIQKLNLKKANAIIADSYASKRDIVHLVGVPEEKVHVVHLAAENVFHPIKNPTKEVARKFGLPEKFALYVGDVTWNKNVPMLVRAAIKAEIPLVMVGKTLVSDTFDATNPWNNDLVEVQKLAKEHPTIIRLGFVSTEDLVSLYNLAKVFVFPSIYEGFGLPVIEAMQSGCPVVTTKGGSLEEVAAESALFVNPYDIESIVSGMTKVFRSEELQKKMSEKGLLHAKKFTWKKTAEETIAVYNKVINR